MARWSRLQCAYGVRADAASALPLVRSHTVFHGVTRQQLRTRPLLQVCNTAYAEALWFVIHACNVRTACALTR
jgi:IS5 family transposase